MSEEEEQDSGSVTSITAASVIINVSSFSCLPLSPGLFRLVGALEGGASRSAAMVTMLLKQRSNDRGGINRTYTKTVNQNCDN